MHRIEEIEFSKASDLLDYLGRRQPHWGTGVRPGWIFRGQTDGSKPLLPRAWRPGFRRGDLEHQLLGQDGRNYANDWCKEHFGPAGPSNPSLSKLVQGISNVEEKRKRFADAICQTQVEMFLVIHFHMLADELGFDVPDIARQLARITQLYGQGGLNRKDAWCATEPDTIHCFAQHHNIETRLLDWTLNPLVAAFFSIDDWKASEGKPAVWALDRNRLLDGQEEQHSGLAREDRPLAIRFKTCPRSRHNFLHAQHGLFTWIDGADGYFVEHGDYPSLETTLHVQCASETRPVLRKLALEPSQVEEMERLLLRERISKAHLMPTLNNVSATVLREAIHDMRKAVG